jgi:hypothetical protein
MRPCRAVLEHRYLLVPGGNFNGIHDFRNGHSFLSRTGTWRMRGGSIGGTSLGWGAPALGLAHLGTTPAHRIPFRLT